MTDEYITNLTPAQFAAHEALEVCSFTEHAGGIRFLNGTLQQEWIVTCYKGGSPVSATPEWRDVPHEID